MNTTKWYTNPDQSNRLKDLIGTESADVKLLPVEIDNSIISLPTKFDEDSPITDQYSYAWSLTALMNMLGEYSKSYENIEFDLDISNGYCGVFCVLNDKDYKFYEGNDVFDNIIDCLQFVKKYAE